MIQQNVLDKFKELFGADGDIRVYFAPGRVNLIGEHTDYNEGFVLPFAIDRTARVAVGIRPDSTVRLLSTYGDQGMVSTSLDHLEPGKDLVADTLTALAHQGKVLAYPYDGFWMPADTVKERVVLDRLAHSGEAPWEIWRHCREALEPTGASDPAVADVVEPLSGR